MAWLKLLIRAMPPNLEIVYMQHCVKASR
jgi:hypothetical protein